ncbi:hypothetical protein H5410_005375 [Solanum commersonii]|uniref:Uncharacterized protein n=1 Tax=Solanum commersonii TaxID=4109 RepID=A0A9J6A6G7_SOLCO|nr:hypothetical protein H5410_005375 [Solanum commersonii]
MEHTPLTNCIRAELQEIWRGLMLVVEHNLNPPKINTDSSEAIKMIQSNNLLYDDVIVECRVSDTLAKEGVKESAFGVQTILTVPPIFAQKEVDADTLGNSYARTTNNETNIS